MCDSFKFGLNLTFYIISLSSQRMEANETKACVNLMNAWLFGFSEVLIFNNSRKRMIMVKGPKL